MTSTATTIGNTARKYFAECGNINERPTVSDVFTPHEQQEYADAYEGGNLDAAREYLWEIIDGYYSEGLDY